MSSASDNNSCPLFLHVLKICIFSCNDFGNKIEWRGVCSHIPALTSYHKACFRLLVYTILLTLTLDFVLTAILYIFVSSQEPPPLLLIKTGRRGSAFSPDLLRDWEPEPWLTHSLLVRKICPPLLIFPKLFFCWTKGLLT